MRVIWMLAVLGIILGTKAQKMRRALPQDIKDEILAHKDDIDRIKDYVLNGNGHHQAYNRLANFTDTYGPRVTASQALAESIDGMVARLKDEGFENVGKEVARAPDWRRGREWATMLSPIEKRMDIFGLGSSIGGNITAEIIVVKSFDELAALSNEQVAGKIVVYNQGWTDYGHGYAYRNDGAKKASEKGAVATLIRSVTQYSLYTPHTGQQGYGEAEKIPTACTTIEDTDLMQRLADEGYTVTVNIYMEAENFNDTISHNVVGEWRGSTKPEETVIIGGHIDSWDVGMGVMDDAGGVIISWQAISVLKALDLRPKRTIRVVFWTSEEEGLIGAEDYFEAHKDEINTTSIVMESDAGTFTPLGIGFTGSGLARAMLEETMTMLNSIDAGGVTQPGSSPDTGDWERAGVPVGNLWNMNQDYFIYHHTHADTMTMMNADDLDLCSITWATAAFVIANLEDMLPREGDYPEDPSGATVLGYPSPLFLSLLALLSLTKWF